MQGKCNYSQFMNNIHLAMWKCFMAGFGSFFPAAFVACENSLTSRASERDSRTMWERENSENSMGDPFLYVDLYPHYFLFGSFFMAVLYIGFSVKSIFTSSQGSVDLTPQLALWGTTQPLFFLLYSSASSSPFLQLLMLYYNSLFLSR